MQKNRNGRGAAVIVSPLMRKVSAYIAAAASKALPAEVTERTKRHVLDTFASMVSGSRLRPGRKAIAYARSVGGRPQAGIPGTRIVTSAVTAALVNGVLAHADETDDSHVGTSTHPGCAIVPAALAVAELQQSSGTAFLRAVALGYDICSRLSLSLGPMRLYRAGHSSHSIAGSFGAAAAAASLMRLDERGVRHAISYTVQQASGIPIWMRDPDHIEKAFDFAGMPARNGVTAAIFVGQGWTGVDDVFAGERNFYFAFGGEATASKLVEALGRRYEVMNTQIKKWSVGSPILAPLSSTEVLMRENSQGRRPQEQRYLSTAPGGVDAARRRHYIRVGARRRANAGSQGPRDPKTHTA
jgi:2-methylcitrate dehydratase PrpD